LTGGSTVGTRGHLYNLVIDILLVCTANQCRSPMAEGLLRRLFALSGVGATVGSAGLLPGGSRATDEAITTMAKHRIDIRQHVSRTIDTEMARTTPLVIGMTRQHVRESCATYGAPMERTFTLKELVRRGEEAGGRVQGEPVHAWLARVGAGRRSADLMGDDPDDDIADPVGRPRAVYEATADELEGLLRRVVDLLVGGPPRSAAYADPSRVRRGVIRPGDDYASDTSTGYSWR
jgi:protein-tyrosine phosphatase